MKEQCDNLKEQLGPDALLGVQYIFLDETGEILAQEGYNENVMLPMASTKKIVIALAILKEVFHTKCLNLDTQLLVKHDFFSPGRPTNSLDRRFFIPWSIGTSKTINQLLDYMLKESDNTATDVLINELGGIHKINEFIREDLKINGFKLSYSSKDLLSFFYNVANNSKIGIALAFLSAYTIRLEKEQEMVSEELDTCSPFMMAELLRIMIIEYQKGEDTWINKATDIIFRKMEGCRTGDNLIKKGIHSFSNQISRFGSKQGSVGGIRNDTAFMHLKDGRWLVISIHTCLSNLSYQERDSIIADLSHFILSDICHLLPDNTEKKIVQSGGCTLI